MQLNTQKLFCLPGAEGAGLAVGGAVAALAALTMGPLASPLAQIWLLGQKPKEAIEDTVRLKDPIQVRGRSPSGGDVSRHIRAAGTRMSYMRMVPPPMHASMQGADLARPVEIWGEDALLQWPGARQPLIAERDAYMARTIWAAATGAPPGAPVGVSGCQAGPCPASGPTMRGLCAMCAELQCVPEQAHRLRRHTWRTLMAAAACCGLACLPEARSRPHPAGTARASTRLCRTRPLSWLLWARRTSEASSGSGAPSAVRIALSAWRACLPMRYMPVETTAPRVYVHCILEQQEPFRVLSSRCCGIHQRWSCVMT